MQPFRNARYYNSILKHMNDLFLWGHGGHREFVESACPQPPPPVATPLIQDFNLRGEGAQKIMRPCSAQNEREAASPFGRGRVRVLWSGGRDCCAPPGRLEAPLCLKFRWQISNFPFLVLKYYVHCCTLLQMHGSKPPYVVEFRAPSLEM